MAKLMNAMYTGCEVSAGRRAEGGQRARVVSLFPLVGASGRRRKEALVGRVTDGCGWGCDARWRTATGFVGCDVAGCGVQRSGTVR